MSPKSIKVSWKPPKRKHWKGKIEYYKLMLTLNNASYDVSKQAQPMSREVLVRPIYNHPDPSLATEPLKIESQFIQELEENFKYTLSIVVTNAAGSSTASAPAVQKMPQAGEAIQNIYVLLHLKIFCLAPTGPPINIRLQNVSLSTLNITWLPPEPADANGIITGYDLIFIRIKIEEVTQDTLPSNQKYFFKKGILRNEFLKIIVLGLHSFEAVSIRIAAKTIIGRGPFSSIRIFRTNEGSRLQNLIKNCNYFDKIYSSKSTINFESKLP